MRTNTRTQTHTPAPKTAIPHRHTQYCGEGGKEGKEQIRRMGVDREGDLLFLKHNCQGESLDIGWSDAADRNKRSCIQNLI